MAPEVSLEQPVWISLLGLPAWLILNGLTAGLLANCSAGAAVDAGVLLATCGAAYLAQQVQMAHQQRLQIVRHAAGTIASLAVAHLHVRPPACTLAWR